MFVFLVCLAWLKNMTNYEFETKRVLIHKTDNFKKMLWYSSYIIYCKKSLSANLYK